MRGIDRRCAPCKLLGLNVAITNDKGIADLGEVAGPEATKERLEFFVSDGSKQAFSADISGESTTLADVLLSSPP